MAKRLQSWIVDGVAANLKLPRKSVFGRLTMHMFLNKNTYLEENAVKLCNIKPDYKVLEIGFGPGFGLEAAHKKVKHGTGKIYGIDTSLHMVEMSAKRLRKAVQNKKVILFHGSAAHIPLNTDSIHRVFHANCFYFWPNMRLVMREIYRVIKPGGLMVTVLNMENLKSKMEKGYMKYGNTDLVKYMTCLENYGFEGVHIEYKIDDATGKPYQVIYAEVNEKPAHHADMLSDDSDEDELPPNSMQKKEEK